MTRLILVVDEGRKSAGVGEGVITSVVEAGHGAKPLRRVVGADTYTPLAGAAFLDSAALFPAYFAPALAPARALVDAAMVSHLKGELGVDRAALIKYWITDNQCKLVDECLQLFGGYGYMKEYPIARLWADSRVQRIYGGTNEIMKELASRFL